jgi:hypothetical protein
MFDSSNKSAANGETEVFTFVIASHRFRELFRTRSKRGLGKGWTNVVYEGFHQKHQTCALIMERNYLKKAKTRNSSCPFWLATAHCAVANCVSVTFQITDEPAENDDVTVTVKIRGKCSHMDSNDDNMVQQTNRRPLTGLKRLLTVNEMKINGQSSGQFYYEKLSTMSDCETKSGNTSDCYSPAVLRQASYETRKSEQLHENDVLEVDIQRKVLTASMPGKIVSGFIQTLWLFPFTVLLFCEKQVNAYLNSIRQTPDSTLHFDATGSIVKLKEKTGHDTVFVYSGVLAENSMPVFEIITSWHRAFAIESHINIFNGYVRLCNNGQLLKPRYVITDFSYALINACIHAFNDMNLVTYLRMCDSILSGQCNAAQIDSMTFVNLCAAHIMKSFAVKVNKVLPNAKQRKVLMVWFVGLQKCTVLSQALQVYTDIYIVFNTKADSTAVDNARKRLCELIIDGTVDIEYDESCTTVVPDDTNDETVCTASTVKAMSPFTTIFNNALQSHNAVNDDELVVTNEFYCTSAFKCISDMIHLYPMWSAILQSNTHRFCNSATDDVETPTAGLCRTNAVVESHFRSMKHGRTGSNSRVRPRQFIEAEVKYVLGKFNEQQLPQFARSKKRKLLVTDLTCSQDGWNKSKRRATYSNPSKVRQILSQNSNSRKSAIKRASQTQTERKKTVQTKVISSTETTTKKSNAVSRMFPSKPCDRPIKTRQITTDEVQQTFDILGEGELPVSGLQCPGLGAAVRMKSVPRFKPIPVGQRFVQILHTPGHWICASNVHSRTANEIYVYDSAPSAKKTICDEAVVQLTSLLRLVEQPDYLLIRLRNAATQPRGSDACGYYAIACAVAICQGNEPTLWRYEHNEMISAIQDSLRQHHFNPLKPTSIANEACDLNRYTGFRF